MLKKNLVLLGAAAVVSLSACSPAQPPAPPDQNAAQPPAGTAPAATPAPVDQQAEQIKEEERKLAHLKREQAQAQAAMNPPPPPVCQDCGTVVAITAVRQEGQAGAVGTLGGAAAGGLVGNQFGKGKGRVATTILGVVGGALAGREVEKQVNASTVYQVAVNMDTGGQQTVTIADAQGLGVGSHVHVQGQNLFPY
jgi:uncharacterized protein YcfJ